MRINRDSIHALLSLYSLSPETTSGVYSQIARDHGLRERSLPAFRAHISRRLVAVLLRFGLDQSFVPALARALTAHGAAGTSERGHQFDSKLNESRTSELLSAAQKALGLTERSESKTRAQHSLAKNISSSLLSLAAEAPFVAHDPRMNALAEQVGLSEVQVNAQRAWLTIRMKSYLERCMNTDVNPVLTQGVISLAGRFVGPDSLYPVQQLKAESVRLATLTEGLLDGECIETIARQFALVMTKSSVRGELTVDGYTREECLADWRVSTAYVGA